jgi:hypothetical protein
VTEEQLAVFRNVLLIRRLDPAKDVGEDFREQVYEKNYLPPINTRRLSPWFPQTAVSVHNGHC